MTPRSNRPDDAALLRYVSGESALAEALQIEEWMAGDAELAASIAELRLAWGKADSATPEWDRAGVWKKIAAETRPSRVSPVQGVAAFEKQQRAWMWPVAIAATLMITVIGGLVMKRAAVEQVVPVTWREVTTARAQQAVLDLADGSRVTLAAGSRLRIPSDFTARRELELVGRAFFTVVHDTTRPFLVHTATSTTEDIGTAFVVTQYADAARAEVVVTDGSVALGAREQKALMTLEKGDVATLDSVGTATVRRNVDVERYVSWTKGVLSIDNMRLADAISELERWYDIEIRLGDARLGERRVTAQLRAEPAARAAERLALVLGAWVTQRGDTVTIWRRT